MQKSVTEDSGGFHKKIVKKIVKKKILGKIGSGQFREKFGEEVSWRTKFQFANQI